MTDPAHRPAHAVSRLWVVGFAADPVSDAPPTANMIIEPVELTYELELLAPGRVPFRRWRWELWNGAQLLAAGWRVSALHAQRAMRVHALRYAHRLHGLHPLRVERAATPESAWGRRPIFLEWGDLRVLLTPRDLATAR